MKKLIIFLCLFLSVPAFAKPIVLDDDPGGDVSTYTRWFKRLAASGTPIEIKGMCVSACSLVLMLPSEQVCVDPTASLGFHLAAIVGEDGNPIPVPDETAALERRYYPKAIQDWLKNKKLTQPIVTYISAAELIKLGVYKACSGNDS